MPNSAELDRLRWAWSIEAVARLRAHLRGVDEALEHSDLAHVMVLGDSQVGKTTLLLRLLGVTDPASAAQAAGPLRAGRGRGESATPVPIRYQWSGDPDRWSLAHGPQRPTEWLTSRELERRLLSFRTVAEGDRLRWDSRERPLEIGLPGRFAGPEPRVDLRVFDLPGLHAAGAQEREAAKALVAVYAPVVDHVVFVLPADQFAEVVRDPAITDNPFLAGWGEQPQRFSLVFTRAFSGDSVRRHLLSVLGLVGSPAWSRDEVVEAVQEYYDSQLRVSELPSGNPHILFPVEIGESWHELLQSGPEDRCYAEAVAPACEVLLGQLSDSVARYSDADRKYLAASEIATRVEMVVQDNRRRRRAELGAARQAWRRSKKAHEEALRLLDRAGVSAAAARKRVRLLEGSLDRLSSWPIPYQRPERPGMEGNRVRAKQVEERSAWTKAGRKAWTEWRRTFRDPAVPELPPHDLSTGTRDRYDELCACCEQCESGWWIRNWRGSQTPDHCYGRMTGVDEGMRTWIRTALHEHATPAIDRVRKTEAEAVQRRRLAQRYAARTAAEVVGAKSALDALHEQAARHRAEDASNLAVARSVRAMHNEKNETYVRQLLTRAAASAGDERAWLFLAAMRGVHDLNRMFS